MRWTVHGEQTVYDSPWISVRVADVELPDGARIRHDVVRFPRDAASCLVYDPERGLLLLYRHRFITDTWGWEVPGGGLEPDEAPEQAAARECLEETGWRPGPLCALGSWYPMGGRCDQGFHAFRAAGADQVGEPADAHEAERIEWVPLPEARELVARGEVSEGFSLTSLLLFLAQEA